MQRYSTLDLVRFPMGDKQEWIYSPLTQKAQLLPSVKARLLAGCRAFATLDQHAFTLCQQLGMDIQMLPTIKEQLQEFVDSNLLVSVGELCKQFGEKQTDNITPPLSFLGVPTRNRPEHLMRCLDSFIECSNTHGHDLQIVVADDSDSREMQESNRQVLELIKKRFGASCFYIGETEKEEFSRLIADQAGVPNEIVRFALLNDERYPVGTGGNRNALLLDSVEELALQVDDDAMCHVIAAPEQRHGITFTSQYNPSEFWFLSESESAPIGTPDTDIDFFALHAQLLGKPLSSCVDEHEIATAVVDQVKTTFFRRLGSGENRVAVTALGVYGDSGAGQQFGLLRLDGSSRARLVRSAESFRYAMNDYQILRTTSGLTISDGTFCSGLNLGLDNRQCLPPFMPVQRNQDGIFASLLRAGAEGYFGFLPWALVHRRPERWKHDLFKRSAVIYSGEIIETVVGAFKPVESAGSKANFRALGASLVQLGSIPSASFRDLLQHLLWQRALVRINLLEGLMSKYGRQPEYWAKDVNDYLTALRQGISSNDYVIPADLAEVFGIDAAALMMQRLVRQLGELLQVWPDIRQAALTIRKNGRHFGRPI